VAVPRLTVALRCWATAKSTQRQGTAVKTNYQMNDAAAMGLAVPESVTLALAELAGDVQEGLLAMAVGTGLQVMAAMMNADVAAVCGPKGRHDPDRRAVRHGTEAGSVTLGGRRVPVTRPRMRAVDGTGELPVPAYELFSRTEVLGRMAMERMLAGLSTRRYPVGLEPVGQRVEQSARSTSKSAVSRRFVAATETALGELLAAPLDELDLVALMIDGVHGVAPRRRTANLNRAPPHDQFPDRRPRPQTTLPSAEAV
jgi:putative transposase